MCKLLVPITCALGGLLLLLMMMIMPVLLLHRGRHLHRRRVFTQYEQMPNHTHSLLCLHDDTRVKGIVMFTCTWFVVSKNRCNVVMECLGLGRVSNAFTAVSGPLLFDLPNEPAGAGSG